MNSNPQMESAAELIPHLALLESHRSIEAMKGAD